MTWYLRLTNWTNGLQPIYCPWTWKKTQYVQFITKNTCINEISVSYNNTFILNSSNTKFLGLVTDESLSWKDHITQLIPKLSKACYALRSIRLYMTQDALKTVYYSYLFSLISYGIIFWGNSSYSSHIFQLQKKAVRIITGLKPRDSCRELFKRLRILPLQSQYIPFEYLLWTIRIFFM